MAGFLPTTPRSNRPDPLRSRIMVYGEQGVGKSSLAWAWNPSGGLMIDTETGTRLVDGDRYVVDLLEESHRRQMSEWRVFEELVKELRAGGHDFPTVVIDSVDRLYEACDRYVGTDHGVSAAGLVEYGRGTADVDGRFRTLFQELLAMPIGLWVTSHARAVEQEGKAPPKLEPTLNKRVRDYVMGSMDYVLYAERVGTSRVLHSQPTATYKAKARVPLADPMPMDARRLFDGIANGSGHTQAARPTTQAAPPPDHTDTTEEVTA